MRGLIPSAFPAGAFAFPSNQQLEVLTYMKATFTITIKKSERLIVRIFPQLKYYCHSLFKYIYSRCLASLIVSRRHFPLS
ncbi:hypothetical protein FDZ14_22940 [Priestia megaterium]|uniref:Uncharacterized protein n=1 Tax=Priestia megaterium TaxID=1404 RepID=A0A6M6DZH4_PRIMG|nr:hypothetical protein [Priestia megaterium]QCY23931.1 hypothetical protein EQG57_04810 [Priestia megaterium NBRC 15308 = ATCC 14581]QJX78906.1 hypothetical protein FDZ14_22940 [Priestia megaterium]THJ43409.1 hypothetical protein E7L53_05755 [Priestia megaterium]